MGCTMLGTQINRSVDMLSSNTDCGGAWSLTDRFTTFLDLGSAAALRTHHENITGMVQDHISEYQRELVKVVGKGMPGGGAMVGIGALLMSIVMDEAIAHVKREPSSENVLQKVFAKEKVTGVRDVVEGYRRRWKMNLQDTQNLIMETGRYGTALNDKMIRVRNSMLKEGQFNPRALTMWIHGATFHVHMQIYKARLEGNRGASATARLISSIDGYLREMVEISEKYNPYINTSVTLSLEELNKYNASSDTLMVFMSIPSNPCIPPDIPEKYRQRLPLLCPMGQPMKNFLTRTKNNVDQLLLETGSFQV